VSTKKILVMCTGNSFRSHMAQAYIEHFAGDAAQVYSAGVKASGKVYPWAIKLMAEDGIDISNNTSDQVDQYLDIAFDFLITVCDNAKETCPIFPKPVGKKLHQSFKDYEPQGALSDEEYMQTLRPIRDAIKEYCKTFVQTEL
jgi:arsenate reductase (thioredoxin)